MNDNQNINSELLQQLTETHRQAPTISRFVEEHFSELVPHSDYFAHLVRDDVGGEMLPPLPEEVTDAEAHRFNSTLRETVDVATQLYEALRRFDSSHTKVTLALSEQQSRYVNRRLVRYDDTETTPTASTKPEEVLARLPSEFTRADAVRVGGEFGVAVRTIERYLTIWQKTCAIESVSRGHYRRITV